MNGPTTQPRKDPTVNLVVPSDDVAASNGNGRKLLPYQFRWRQMIADNTKLSASAVFFADSLSTWMSGSGRCCPSTASIAKRMRCGERTVERARQELKEAGYLEVEIGKGRKTKSGQATNLYIGKLHPRVVTDDDASPEEQEEERVVTDDDALKERVVTDDSEGSSPQPPEVELQNQTEVEGQKKELEVVTASTSFSETDSPESVPEEQTDTTLIEEIIELCTSDEQDVVEELRDLDFVQLAKVHAELERRQAPVTIADVREWTQWCRDQRKPRAIRGERDLLGDLQPQEARAAA
jgi:hypothetical protein